MTKIYDEDIQYKDDVVFLAPGAVVVDSFRSKAQAIVDVGTAVSTYTIDSGQAGMAFLVGGAVTCDLTLPAADQGMLLNFCVYGTAEAVTLIAAGDDLFYAANGTTATTQALTAFTYYTLFAVDDDSWIYLN